MSEPLLITVPCRRCAGAIAYGESKCAQCASVVSKEQREALHARLAAASADYRDLLEQIRSGRTALLVASLVYLALALMGLWVIAQAQDDATVAAARETMLLNLLYGTGFLGCWSLAKRMPTLGLLLAAGVWLVLQILLALIDPIAGLAGLWVKGIMAVLMSRGIIAGLRANTFTRKLVLSQRSA